MQPKRFAKIDNGRFAKQVRELIEIAKLSGRTDLDAQIKATEASLEIWTRNGKNAAGSPQA
jgi:hypothetical protein